MYVGGRSEVTGQPPHTCFHLPQRTSSWRVLPHRRGTHTNRTSVTKTHLSQRPPPERKKTQCLNVCYIVLQVLSLSSGEVDDWDRNEARSAPSHMKDGPDLNDEEEEENDVAEVERGQERRKVTVRSVPKDNPDVSNWLQTSKTLRRSWSKLG